MSKDTIFIEVAKEYASLSEARKKHGAIVVKKGRIIGRGYNKNTNNPKYVSEEHIKTGCSRHAEVEAMRNAQWNVRGCTLYVARINRMGQIGNSKPCIYCQERIKNLGIKRIVYTTGERKWISMNGL